MSKNLSPVFAEHFLAPCIVPVPYGYPQSQTHTGVAVHNDVVYLCSSPYPRIKRSFINAHWNGLLARISKRLAPKPSDALENPMLYKAAEKGAAPTVFIPYPGNPVFNTPAPLFGHPSFNSDPDIYIENDVLYLTNRTAFRKTKPGSLKFDCMCQGQLFRFSIKDDEWKYLDTTILYEYHNAEVCSPSFQKYQGKYVMMWLATSSYNTGSRDCKMMMRTSNAFDIHFDKEQEIVIDSGEYTPWHMSLFKYEEKLYTIIACIKDGVGHRLYQMLGEFDSDLKNVYVYRRPLVDIPSYRGAGYVADNGMFILYSTTVCHRLPGSKSVDGKDVIMAQMQFEDMLNMLKTEE